jgi:hypothetical protein
LRVGSRLSHEKGTQMTTQYTPTLKLALPVTGELSGTWGDTVNDNITSMIEQAIAGLSTIDTWTGNAHTLTSADGTTSESRCAMLVAATGAGGTALTAIGNLICPAAAKLYVLRNGAAYAITLKTSGGTGVSVAAGETAFLFCDGTNVNACVTTIVDGHITGNLTVDGNTTLGNATSDTISATARFNTDLLPSTDNARDLGTSGNSWRNLYVDTLAVIATLNLTNALGVAYGGTGQTTYTDGELLIGNSSGNTLTKATLTQGSGVTITNSAGGISIAATGTGGTVTTVGWTGGIVTVTDPTTTPAFTIAGTSGGLPYFTSSTTWATSAALVANALVVGGGAGTAPATVTTGTGVLTALGFNVNAAGGVPTIDGTATLTNKRINPRTSSTASTATLTPDIASFDQYNLTAQAASLAVAAPTGTPVDGNKILIRILDNGTGRAITWDATYTVIGTTLPTTTTANKMTYVGCIYNSTNTRWDVVAVTTQV